MDNNKYSKTSIFDMVLFVLSELCENLSLGEANREVNFICSLQACAENNIEKEKCENLATIFLLFGY